MQLLFHRSNRLFCSKLLNTVSFSTSRIRVAVVLKSIIPAVKCGSVIPWNKNKNKATILWDIFTTDLNLLVINNMKKISIPLVNQMSVKLPFLSMLQSMMELSGRWISNGPAIKPFDVDRTPNCHGATSSKQQMVFSASLTFSCFCVIFTSL